MKRLYIVGIGMGNPDLLTVEARRMIGEAELIIGAKRMVECFSVEGRREIDAVKPDEIMSALKGATEESLNVVLMSGDVGFYSGAKKLIALLKADGGYEWSLMPGISSLQYMCAQVGMGWDDMKVVSLHGRAGNFLQAIEENKKVFLLMDGKQNVNYVCRNLMDRGLEEINLYVGERLSYSDQRITVGRPRELMDREFDSLSVVILENAGDLSRNTFAIGDEDIIRGDVPMTKAEVRSIVLGKLQLKVEDVAYDIGGGTGAMSIEMALQTEKGRVFSIENNGKAVELIEKNKEKFGAGNLEIVHGSAPEAMADLPKPDKAFIGGSKGNMRDIVRLLLKKNSKVRIVANAIALESAMEALEVFQSEGFDGTEIISVQVSKAKKVGRDRTYHMMMAQNPVFVITAKRLEE